MRILKCSILENIITLKKIQSAPSFYENGSAAPTDSDSATIRILDGNIVAIFYPIHIRSHVWIVTILR